VFWAVVIVSALLLWQTVRVNTANQNIPEISYSHFLSQTASGQVSKVTIAGSVVRGYDERGGSFRVIAPPNQSAMLEALQQQGVEIWFKESPEPTWGNWLLNLAPLALLAALWFFMIRQMQKTNRLRAAGQTSTPSSDSPPRFGP
jgi:cell division protease FtsH